MLMMEVEEGSVDSADLPESRNENNVPEDGVILDKGELDNVHFEILPKGFKGKALLKDSLGFSYTQKRATGDTRTWTCVRSVLKTKPCKATVTEVDGGFKFGPDTHTHESEGGIKLEDATSKVSKVEGQQKQAGIEFKGEMLFVCADKCKGMRTAEHIHCPICSQGLKLKDSAEVDTHLMGCAGEQPEQEPSNSPLKRSGRKRKPNRKYEDSATEEIIVKQEIEVEDEDDDYVPENGAKKQKIITVTIEPSTSEAVTSEVVTSEVVTREVVISDVVKPKKTPKKVIAKNTPVVQRGRTKAVYNRSLLKPVHDTVPLPNEIEGLKDHLSLVRCVEDMVLEKCTIKGCCRNRMHCPMCKFVSWTRKEVVDHVVSLHGKHQIDFGDYRIMMCQCNSGDSLAWNNHYHCPICGETRRRKKRFIHHVVICGRSFDKNLQDFIDFKNIHLKFAQEHRNDLLDQYKDKGKNEEDEEEKEENRDDLSTILMKRRKRKENPLTTLNLLQRAQSIFMFKGNQILKCECQIAGIEPLEHFHCPYCQAIVDIYNTIELIDNHLESCYADAFAKGEITELPKGLDERALAEHGLRNVGSVPAHQVDGLHYNVSITRSMQDVLEYSLQVCTLPDCCGGKVHCPICPKEGCFTPAAPILVREHLRLSHFRQCILFGDYSILMCTCLSEVQRGTNEARKVHYHCPICGDTRRRKARHLYHMLICGQSFRSYMEAYPVLQANYNSYVETQKSSIHRGVNDSNALKTVPLTGEGDYLEADDDESDVDSEYNIDEDFFNSDEWQVTPETKAINTQVFQGVSGTLSDEIIECLSSNSGDITGVLDTIANESGISWVTSSGLNEAAVYAFTGDILSVWKAQHHVIKELQKTEAGQKLIEQIPPVLKTQIVTDKRERSIQTDAVNFAQEETNREQKLIISSKSEDGAQNSKSSRPRGKKIDYVALSSGKDNIGENDAENGPESDNEAEENSSVGQLPQDMNIRVITKGKRNYATRENSIHKCERCALTSRVFADVTQHMKMVHGEKLPLRCDVCCRSFKRRSYLELHLNLRHWPQMKSSNGVCDVCDLEFSSDAQLQWHKNYNHSINKQNLLKQFFDSGYKNPVKPCPFCGVEFKMTNMHVHIRTKHEDQATFCCPKCGETFESRHNYKMHLDEHKWEQRHICELCGLTFTMKSILNNHLATHSDAGSVSKKYRYVCEVCGQKFLAKASYHQHVSAHTGIRPFCCDICGKGFKSQQAMKKHRVFQHDGENYPFKCEHCNKGFRVKVKYDEHMATHNPVSFTKYSCAECNKPFVSTSTLRIHMARAHNITTADQMEEIIINPTDSSGRTTIARIQGSQEMFESSQEEVGNEVSTYVVDNGAEFEMGPETVVDNAKEDGSDLVSTEVFMCSECQLIFNNLNDAQTHIVSCQGPSEGSSLNITT